MPDTDTADDPPPKRTASRVGPIGIVAFVGLALCAVLGFIVFTDRVIPPRSCRGHGVASAAPATSPERAIEGFAGTHQVARWQGDQFSVPPDGWLRRTENVYEQSVEDDRLLMVDVGQSPDGWSVSGLWLCTPTPSAS